MTTSTDSLSIWPRSSGGCADEATAVNDAELRGEAPALLEQVLREVAEEDKTGAPFESAECDQAISATDIEERLAPENASPVEDAVARRPQPLHVQPFEGGVPSEAPVE